MLQNAYLLAKIGADTAENERIFDMNFLRIRNCHSDHLIPPSSSNFAFGIIETQIFRDIPYKCI